MAARRYNCAMDMRERIEQRLGALGKSVRGASLEAGLGETTLRNYLKGMTNSMTVDNVEKLAPVLDASVRWLMFGDEAEIINLWERIPIRDRDLARDMLETIISRKAK